MGAYLMIGQPFIKNEIYKRGTIHNLNKVLSQGKIDTLIEMGVVRHLDKTPPVSEYPELADYAELLTAKNIFTIADFAVADSDEIADIPHADEIQKNALKMIDYNNVASLDKCCGESALPFPFAK